jgi:hypothetical protein
MKTDVNVPLKSNKRKNAEKNVFLLASATDEKSMIRKSVVRIRIRTKMSRIHNTDFARV